MVVDMYRVIAEFKDITNLQHRLKIGDEFTSKDTKRIKNLLERGLITKEETKSEKPKK